MHTCAELILIGRRHINDELKAERAADKQKISVLHERLAAYGGGACGQLAAAEAATPQHRPKRKSPDQVPPCFEALQTHSAQMHRASGACYV